jgi:hypothetical protein
MSFRINSTGRKRIFREDIRIKIVDLGNGLPPVFSADIKLAPELSLDPTARVYVEPYVGSSSMRFSFGTVAKISPPESCVLSDIDAGASILFRVKVVDESTEVGRILAAANGIKPESDADGDERKPLLPLRTVDLGDEIWRLEIDKDGGPTLTVNSRIADLADRMRTDTLLQGAVYPEVVRQMVRAAFANADADSEDDDGWASDWKTWLAEQIGREVTEDEVSDGEDLAALANEVAAAFAKKQHYATLVAAARLAI